MINANSRPTRFARRRAFVASLLTLAFVGSIQAAAAKKGPASKLFVTEVAGEAAINIGSHVKDLEKRTVHTADGTVIETRKSLDESNAARNFSSMVYSNGTGMFVDADTRVEVKKFVQEPFAPNRSDMDLEPSISQTQAYLARGSVGLCTSKLAAGSSMVYQTQHAAVNVRGRRVVIEANDRFTKISMLEGESTIRAGSAGSIDLGGQVLKAGQQAIIMAAPPGVVPEVRIVSIPQQDIGALDNKVAMACTAKKTVYFDSVEKKVADASGQEETKAEEKSKEGEPEDKELLTEKSVPEGLGVSEKVTAFDQPEGATLREIVAIEVVPAQLPVEFAVSKAKL